MTIWKKSHNKTIHTEDDIVIIVDERKLLAEKKKTMDVLSSTIRELMKLLTVRRMLSGTRLSRRMLRGKSR